jgi:hypothetical protein
VNQIPTIYHNKGIVFFILDDFDERKQVRDVRTIIFHPFSRREIRHAPENKVFRV